MNETRSRPTRLDVKSLETSIFPTETGTRAPPLHLPLNTSAMKPPCCTPSSRDGWTVKSTELTASASRILPNARSAESQQAGELCKEVNGWKASLYSRPFDFISSYMYDFSTESTQTALCLSSTGIESLSGSALFLGIEVKLPSTCRVAKPKPKPPRPLREDSSRNCEEEKSKMEVRFNPDILLSLTINGARIDSDEAQMSESEESMDRKLEPMTSKYAAPGTMVRPSTT